MIDPEKIMAWHGFLPEKRSGNELLFNCLWCGREQHLSMRVDGEKAGVWNCLVCGESGNIHKMLYKIWSDAYSTINNDDEYGNLCVNQLAKLSANRSGFPLEKLVEWGIAYNLKNDSFIVPIFKSNDQSLLNLAKLDDKFKMLGSPGLRVGATIKLGSINRIDEYNRVIILTEGIWDAIALDLMIQNAPKKSNPFIVSLPGCMSFNDKIMRDLNISLSDKVIVLFDDDDPGRAGINKVFRFLKPEQVWLLDWNRLKSELEIDQKIKDIRDLYDASENVEKTWELIKKSIVRSSEVKSVQIEENKSGDSVTSFSELLEHWKAANLWVSGGMVAGLACALAVVCSCSELAPKTDQLWFRIVGPPGCGKTTIAESISVNKDFVKAKSIITGIHSGWGKDSNLFDELRNRVLIIKDADTIANMPNYSQIMSELRDVYDGTSRAHYRNKIKVEEENIRMGLILCGTYSLYKLNNSSLGERFLDVELIDKEDEQHIIKLNEEKWENRLNCFSQEEIDFQSYTSSFIDYLRMYYADLYMKLDKDAINQKIPKVKAWASFISKMRSKKIDSEDYVFPVFEVSSRLFNQLMNLLVHLNMVLYAENDKEELIDKIMWRVVKSTIGTHSVRWKIVNMLKTKEMSTDVIAEGINMSTTAIRNHLISMLELGIVTSRKAASGFVAGRAISVWSLDDSVKEVLGTMK